MKNYTFMQLELNQNPLDNIDIQHTNSLFLR